MYVRTFHVRSIVFLFFSLFFPSPSFLFYFFILWLGSSLLFLCKFCFVSLSLQCNSTFSYSHIILFLLVCLFQLQLYIQLCVTHIGNKQLHNIEDLVNLMCSVTLWLIVS